MGNLGLPISATLLILFSKQHVCNSEFTYTAVAPLYIVPGEGYQIFTTLEKADSPPVTFRYKLINEQQEEFRIPEEIILSEPGSISTTLSIASEFLQDDNYNLTVAATDSAGKVEEDKISIKKDFRKSSILIQTDKPIYKPGDIVKFRVFLLNRFLQPFGKTGKVNITFLDSERHVIKVWKSEEVKGQTGFISKEFELSKEPNLGKWMIQVETGNRAESTSEYFSVEEYVLPKYKVEITPSPSFVTFNQSKFVAEVKAIYNYGKAVEGECSVELKENIISYGRKRVPRRIIKTSKLEGGSGLSRIEFDIVADLKIERKEISRLVRDFMISASCVDQSSGNGQNSTELIIMMHEFPYKIELVDKPNHILPGFPVNFTIKVSSQDNLPISDEREDALKIEHGFSLDVEDGVVLTSIPENGLVPLSFVAGTNPLICHESIYVTYDKLRENLRLPSKLISPHGSYLQLKLLTEYPVEGQPIDLSVEASKDYPALNIFLISRGVVIHSKRVEGDGEINGQIVSLALPPKSSPKVKLFVYLVFNDTNIISEGIDLDVKPDEKNKLEISLSDKSLEPGFNVSISLKGNPNSIFGLRAVDQSVFVLRKDNDLTMEKLSKTGDRFFIKLDHHHNQLLGDQSSRKFAKNGLGLLTNAKIDKGTDNGYEYEWGSYHLQSQSSLNSKVSGSGSPTGPRVRSHFPETWIWEDLESPDGRLTLNKTVPDSITSWMISAFQIDPINGLGLAEESKKLTVFRPFFIALNLPYSVVKGEVLFLQVLVHNYQDKPVTAKVTLDNHEGSFRFLESKNNFGKMDKEVEVNASSISSVVFPILASKFGTITVSVKAVTSEAGDAVRRTLIVKPPGIKHTQNSAILINLLTSGLFKKENISAVLPEKRVANADVLKVQVVGSVLGGTIDNLDKLIGLPTGGGEQNMIHIVPNLAILDYLQATGESSSSMPGLASRARRYLERGYQQQLTYLKADGSYSAFGKLDKVGSTWLTAFVTRAFIQSKRYLSIDDDVIKRSLRFLLRMQNDNGSFTEEGFVHDRSLQGGAGAADSKFNQLGITAYTLLAIAEAQKANFDLVPLNHRNKTAEEVITSGVNFLISQTSSNQFFNDVYSTNLITYLLHYIDHPRKDDYFKILEDLAKISHKKGTIHWKQVQRKSTETGGSKRAYKIWKSRTTPATVELTSYGLLTYLLRGEDKLTDSVYIATWLMKQRNAMGGFISTQDTVVGITALAKFAEAINTKANFESVINVRLSSYEPDNHHNFYVGRENRTVLQEYLLPGNTTDVSIEASGRGTALAQLTWTYYVEAVDSFPAFDLKAKLMERDQGRNLHLKIQFFYIRNGKSNMAILEVNAPSGYAFDQDDLEALRKAKLFKRYELEDNDSKLELYFSSVGRNSKTINLRAYRIHLVGKHAKGIVKVYDYYDNTQAAQYLYDVPVISLCDICNSDRRSCGELKECQIK